MTEFVTSKKLPGVIVIKPEVLVDPRGDYTMIYNEKLYAAHGVVGPFVEHCISTSSKGVIRGLHADYACDKLIQCLASSIWYILADPETFQWEGFMLSAQNRWQLYKPRKFAAGLLALGDGALFHYAQSAYYDPSRQQSWRWDDPRFNFHWPMQPTMISERDANADSSLLLK